MKNNNLLGNALVNHINNRYENGIEEIKENKIKIPKKQRWALVVIVLMFLFTQADPHANAIGFFAKIISSYF